MQLKAIKLLWWVFVLRMLLMALNLFVNNGVMESFGGGPIVRLGPWSLPSLGVPKLYTAIAMGHMPVWLAWESVIAQFADSLLTITISGHVIVACCRMAGFNVLRNTYRPLEARSVAEFWNRYYFYFKELLVEFFFFPVFTRYFKQHRRLRVFAATLAAATLGNMICHFFGDYEYVGTLGLWRALVGFQVYAVYALVLGLGIGISQWRAAAGPYPCEARPWWRQALATAGVLLFFCLLKIFDQEERAPGLAPHLRFFLKLFCIELPGQPGS